MMNKLTIMLHAIMLPPASFIMNCWWWLWHINRLPSTVRHKKSIVITSIQDIERFMTQFIWRPEKLEWRPWIITILANNLSDDCDGASFLGKWLIKKYGYKSEVYSLWKKDSFIGHAVCYSQDIDVLISNDNVIRLKAVNWQDGIMKYFNDKYDIISLNGRVVYVR